MTHVENFDVAIRNVLDRLKQALGADSDASLAQMLGVQRSTIATWVRRNSLDWQLLFAKCNGVDLNWLVHGVVIPVAVSNDQSSTVHDDRLDEMEKKVKELEVELGFARGQAQAYKAMAEQAMSLSKTGGTLVKGMAKGFR